MTDREAVAVSFWRKLWDGIDDLFGGIFWDEDQPKRPRRKRRRKRGRRAPLPPREGGTGPDDPYSYARGYDAELDADYRVIAWTGPGGLADWYSLEAGDVPDKKDVEKADLLTIEITYPDGQSVYRTFKGPTADIQRIIDDWKEIGSL